MRKFLLLCSSMLLLFVGITYAHAGVTVPHTNVVQKAVVSKKPITKTCVNNLMCMKNMHFVCTNGKASCVPNTTSSSSARTMAAVAVQIKGFAFSPASITVKKGTTVTWTNMDSMPHTATGNNGGPSSPRLSMGQSYSFAFMTAGTFSYHCAVHPGMTATVIVTN